MISSYGKALGAAFVLLVAATAHALMGGFGISVTLPKPDDARMKDAALILQPIGCIGPGASVKASAEGIEDGVRRSIPLKLSPLTGEKSEEDADKYILKREWPATGKWVLVFTAEKNGMHTTAMVTLDQKGSIQMMERGKDGRFGKTTTLANGKTTLSPWSFTTDQKVVAMYHVVGDVKVAVDHTLKAKVSLR